MAKNTTPIIVFDDELENQSNINSENNNVIRL
jgi:hypothetical protein